MANASIDFETYSEAGYFWNDLRQRWLRPANANSYGLAAVGVAVYARHPSAEILCLAYDLGDGDCKIWHKHLLPPVDLFKHIAAGGLVNAWNSTFEWWVWNEIAVKKLKWPPLPASQLRCTKSKAKAYNLPASLANAGMVLNIRNRKLAEGKSLLNEFSIPHGAYRQDHFLLDSKKPTERFSELLHYCKRDVIAESEINALLPDLSATELAVWQCDQAINQRGVQVDIEGVNACISIIEQAAERYNTELFEITGGQIDRATKTLQLRKWMEGEHNIITHSMNIESVDQLLAIETLPTPVRRILEIRKMIGSSAVKKLYRMRDQTTETGRLHELFMYHSARTGRFAGVDIQPHNFPRGGLKTKYCLSCKHYMGVDSKSCLWCGKNTISPDYKKWNIDAIENALETIKTGNLDSVEYFWGDPIRAVYGCLRSLLVAAPGYELYCSDYSSIEAVVLAELAGEEWRQQLFREQGDIYAVTASKITGVPIEQIDNKLRHLGKTAELASGYQGWVGAWKRFGADEYLSDQEIANAASIWRRENPQIVKLWGGLNNAAYTAVLDPGTRYAYRNISYVVMDGNLFCRLPSGRDIIYHNIQLHNLILSYESWNTDPAKGAIGWIRVTTYGGKLTENVVQAVARDILVHAIINLEKSGYPVVLHLHDEIACEVLAGFGSVQELESIMSEMPWWAPGWPVHAKNGWTGQRFRK